MSMRAHIIGFKVPDATWHKMKAVWDACVAAGITPPKAVYDFFGHQPPDARGVDVDIEKTTCYLPWRDEDRAGFDIELAKLPKDLTHLRFYNSW